MTRRVRKLRAPVATKADLAALVREYTGCSHREARHWVQAVVDAMTATLEEGHPLEIRALGRFTPGVRPAGKKTVSLAGSVPIQVLDKFKTRRPKVDTRAVRVPTQAVVKFSPTRRLREQVLKALRKRARKGK